MERQQGMGLLALFPLLSHSALVVKVDDPKTVGKKSVTNLTLTAGIRYTDEFKDVQFAPNSVDVVYTNSLDHAFDIDRIAREVLKVLKPQGLLLVEAVQGRDQGVNPGFFESVRKASDYEKVSSITAGPGGCNPALSSP